MNRVLCVVIIVLAVGYGALWLATNHYRDNALTYKAQRDKKARELEQANATITDMQVRQRDVAALDAKYSRELADARAENETLRADVAAGRKRLRINATCSGTVREATGTSGVDNATGPRLADTAERDYFILRNGMTILSASVPELSFADAPYRRRIPALTETAARQGDSSARRYTPPRKRSAAFSPSWSPVRCDGGRNWNLFNKKTAVLESQQ